MSCKHCCGADQFFNLKIAEKEFKKYKKKGPLGSTKKLLDQLSFYDIKNKTLLDIGGGIGAIQWHFLNGGASKSLDIDSSSGYLELAGQFAVENNYELRASYRFGDFNDIHESIDQYDFVTLDKVVCCYPDYQLLIKNASGKANLVLSLTMPIGGLISRILSKFAALYFKLIKNPFRTYIHDPAKVNHFIEEQGFTLAHKSFKFPWLVRVYERNNS